MRRFVLLAILLPFCKEKEKPLPVISLALKPTIVDFDLVQDTYCIKVDIMTETPEGPEVVTSVNVHPSAITTGRIFYYDYSEVLASLPEIYVEITGFPKEITQEYEAETFEQVCSWLVLATSRGEITQDIYGFSLPAPITTEVQLNTIFGRKYSSVKVQAKFIPRKYHTQDVLQTGDILMCGGVSPNGWALKSCELYSAQNFDVKPTGPMFSRRYLASSLILDDGRIMISGGIDEKGRILSSVEIYNPETETFEIIGSMLKPRYWHSMFKVEGGVIIVGGVTKGGIPTDIAEFYDEKLNEFRELGKFREGRFGGCYSLLGNEIYAFGGFIGIIERMFTGGGSEEIGKGFKGICSSTSTQPVLISAPYKIYSFLTSVEEKSDIVQKGAEIIAFEDIAFTSGGLEKTEDIFSPSATAYVLDAKGRIIHKTKMLKPRAGHKLSIFLDRVIFVGGGDMDGEAEIFLP